MDCHALSSTQRGYKAKEAVKNLGVVKNLTLVKPAIKTGVW